MSDGPAAKPISLSLFPRGKYSHASSKRSISISSIGHVHVSLKTNNFHELCNSASNRLQGWVDHGEDEVGGRSGSSEKSRGRHARGILSFYIR